MSQAVHLTLQPPNIKTSQPEKRQGGSAGGARHLRKPTVFRGAPRLVWLLLVILTGLSGWPPAVWSGEGEEKTPLKLPEVVIVGQDVSVLKEAKERLVPQELTPASKEVPAEAREKIDLSALAPQGKASPQVTSPGCLFGNPVTGSIARAFLGDEAQYNVGLYRYQNGDYRGALEAFSGLQQDYPQSAFRAAAYYWQGESHAQLGQYDQALKAYQQVIAAFPGERLRDYALLSAADMHVRQQRPAAAVPLLQELLNRYPNSPVAVQARSYLGDTLFRAGQYPEAAGTYSQLLQMGNGANYRAHALFWRAESMFQAGAFEQAEEGYSHFLRSYPRGSRVEEALYGLGWAQLSAQKHRAALETFRRLEREFPRSRFRESLLYAKVYSYLTLKQSGAAQDLYRQLQREFPRGTWTGAATLEFARTAYESGDYDTAASLGRQLVEASPASPLAPVARVLQADLLYREGRFAEAIEAYRRAERDGLPGHVLERTLLKRALASYQRRDFTNAAADLDSLLQQFPNSPAAAEAAFWLGESRFYNRQYRQALQAYQRVPQSSARYPDALYSRGWVHYQSSDWLKAVAEFEALVRNYPEAAVRSEALYRIGEVQFNLKNFDKAIGAYQQLVREYPEDKLVPSARFRIGWVRYKNGQTAQASRDLSEVVRDYPNHPVTAEARYWLGMAHLSEKQLDAARAQFEAVLALRPSPELAGQTVLRLGDTFYNQGKYDAAIEAYQRLAVYPAAEQHRPEAEYGIILSLYQLRRLNDYHTRARAFIEHYPTHPLSSTVLYQLAELLEAEGRPQLAMKTFQEVIDRFGQSELAESARLRRAELLATQGEWAAAAAEYQRVWHTARSEVIKTDALYGLAKAQSELKLYDAAAASYQRLMHDYPAGRFAVAAQRGWAHALTQAGRKAEAKQAWQDWLARAPKGASTGEAHLELGRLWQGEGAYQKALEHFTTALGQGPPELAVQAQYEIGQTYTLQKQYQQGTLELLKVAYLYPQHTRWVQRALFQAAANYEQEQKWPEALAIYQKILKEVAGSESQERASHKIEQLKKKRNSGA
jgi:TolA-binding protein